MYNDHKCCPICNSVESKDCKPSGIKFENSIYNYFRCLDCQSIYLFPVPDDIALTKIYSKSNYHDCHYSNFKPDNNSQSVQLLLNYLTSNSLVLDYGCGNGDFLSSLSRVNVRGVGVEFNKETAIQASKMSGCEVMTVSEFSYDQTKYDLIHVGDVLEHLADPSSSLVKICSSLKSGGILFIEGPIEINPSLVYFCSKLFSFAKYLVKSNHIIEGIPTHLYFTSEKQQLIFLTRHFKNYEVLNWQVSESGWPYSNNGRIKSFIAFLAKLISRFKFSNFTLGNRFIGIFRIY